MPTAILSVYDKSGLTAFAAGLVQMGWTLTASGGTARRLREADLQVTPVAELTRTPEILGGRVKTLHPAVHGGLLSRWTAEDVSELAELGWAPIDLAVVNLYPFAETIQQEDASLDEVIEMIDIGGVALMRAAAKNFQRVILASDPADYPRILAALSEGETSLALRRELAVKGFQTTSAYDRLIADHLAGEKAETLTLYPVQTLRYGENPHQEAQLLGFKPGQTPLGGEALHGKPLSYNNLLDLDAAWRAAVSFERQAVVIVKHLSPCGIAVHENLTTAYQNALASDPISAFGSVVACNRPVDGATAEAMSRLFIECLIAPDFAPEAFDILTKKKNRRLIRMPDLAVEPRQAYRSIVRGVLKQNVDLGDPPGTQWRVVTKRQPTEAEWRDLRFAWRACQFVKSNAVLLASGEATLGIGGGQPNRVDCVRMAVARAGEKAADSVMASDAFFPFPDSIETAAAAGVTAVIQPGGSIRDDQSIQAADEAGLAMVMTGVRHFRH